MSSSDNSPFPSQADFDLDMWRFSGVDRLSRPMIVDSDGAVICRVEPIPTAMVTARRIEMMGELYEELRLLAARANDAGLDVTQAYNVLREFVQPKPIDPDSDSENSAK